MTVLRAVAGLDPDAPGRRDLSPAEVLLPERERPDPLAGDLEYGLSHGGCDLRARLLAHAGDPFVVGLEELDVDLRRIVGHAGNLVLVEIALDRAPILNGDLLPHRVTECPGDLAFDLLAHGERVDEREAFVEHDVDALQPDQPAPTHRHGDR